MNSGVMQTGVLRYLQEMVGPPASDVELLARYVQGHDQSAFAEVVQRYGGLVFGVARRQLPDREGAEDVFQATFLALARSAPRLLRQTPLANWLYTVALRQVRKVRVRAARRIQHESAYPGIPAPADPLAEISGRELLRIVDEEMGRLPEKYRLPILLCCVEGLSREEAARRLGWSCGVVKGRLERGRRRLADRLAKRGVAPSALVLPALADTAVPAELLARTAALAAAPWSAGLPATVLALVAPGTHRLVLAVAVLIGSLALAGAAGLALGGGDKESGKPEPPRPVVKAEEPASRPELPLPAGSTLRFGTSLYRHGLPIAHLAVSRDGTFAVAASSPESDEIVLGSVRAFDLATGRERYTLDRMGIIGGAVALSPDMRKLAVNRPPSVSLLDAHTGKELKRIEYPSTDSNAITGWIAFTPNGSGLAVATADGQGIHLIDVDKGTVTRTFPRLPVNAIAGTFSPDGRYLAGGGWDPGKGVHIVRVWEVATGKELRAFPAGRTGLYCCPTFSPDGATLAVSDESSRPPAIRLFDVAAGKERRQLPLPGCYGIQSVVFAPDGKTVAASGNQGTLLIEAATGRERVRIRRSALGLHFSTDGKVLTGAVGGAIYQWDAASGKSLTPESAGDCAVSQILASSDGRLVVTRGDSSDRAGSLDLWDARTGAHLRRLFCPWKRSVALSPDGRHLAFPDPDGSVTFPAPGLPSHLIAGTRVVLYDLTTGRYVKPFPAFKQAAEHLAFTRDGKTLVTVGNGDGVARVWDAVAGKEVRSFPVVRKAEAAEPHRVWSSVLSPDGRTLAVTYQPAEDITTPRGRFDVRLQDVASGKELHELPGHLFLVLAVAFSPDSRILVTGSFPLSDAVQQATGRPVNQLYVWDVARGQRVAPLPQGLPTGATAAAFAPDGRTFATASLDGTTLLWEVATWSVRAEFRGHRDRVTALAFAPDGRLLSGGLDTTVLAWDPRPPRPRARPALGTAWDDLGRAEAKPAFAAQGRLLASPAESIALFAEKIKAVEPADPKRLARLIADLDSPVFATRQQATSDLKGIGSQAAPAVREAVKKADSLEIRRRLENLLDEWDNRAPSPAELRMLRAVEVLEWANTPEARKLLTRWATGAPGTRLTAAAEGALQRVKAMGR
jgi:RNA polymerase sigma factor (sigma-70 family)